MACSSGLEGYVTSGGEERCRQALRVYERRDTNTPAIAGRDHSLIVDGVPSELDLRQLLTSYYAEQRTPVEASRAPNKNVAVSVYPTERRAKIGGPEWTGRAMTSGEHVPEKPELTLHLPDADAECTSPAWAWSVSPSVVRIRAAQAVVASRRAFCPACNDIGCCRSQDGAIERPFAQVRSALIGCEDRKSANDA
ncbi:MAG: hypothetical protein H6718_19985 [Polyangiaceae bacterium]|nr:hypothetical protein [Polyangiaceae bacterium]MCB9605508.1 hypothetical protein [Polyangiaceae bacterium]